MKGSNIEGPSGDRRNNGFLPLSGGASTVDSPNEEKPGDHRAGSYPLGGSASPVNPPNNTPLRPGHSGQDSNPTVIAPGEGAVPVGPPPFQGGDQRVPASILRPASAR
jgi:hypothetical protein